jgi:hypothetical protein
LRTKIELGKTCPRPGASFIETFERIPTKQTIQTALNSATQNELGKPAIQSLSSISKMFLGKTCPHPGSSFIETFERIPTKQTIQTALNSATQNELGKPAIQSLSSISKMFLGKTCPRPNADFIETFESRTMKNTIQAAFRSSRTCAPSEHHSPPNLYEQRREIFLFWAILIYSYCIGFFGPIAMGLNFLYLATLNATNRRNEPARPDVFIGRVFCLVWGLYCILYALKFFFGIL